MFAQMYDETGEEIQVPSGTRFFLATEVEALVLGLKEIAAGQDQEGLILGGAEMQAIAKRVLDRSV